MSAVLVSALFPLALVACGESALDNGDSSGGKAASGQSAGDSGRDPGTLVIAEIPSENAATQAKSNAPLIKLLEKETGKKVTVQNVTSYAAVIEAQRVHKVDLAFYGPLSYVVAKDSGVDVTPIGTTVDAKGGSSAYQSYGIVPGKSSIKDLKGFKGKKVCFVDPTSTSGYLYPRTGLIKAGLNPDKDIKTVMSGGHDASALAVKSGQCDAGFAYDDMVDKLLPQQGELKPGDLKVVWRSDEIPGSPVGLSTDLTPSLQKKLTDTFLTKANADYMAAQGFCTGQKDCLPDGAWGYQKSVDADFKTIRDVCAATKDKQCQNG
ncbi:phosphate/phosphite/phosphonate ABC transporter substrate-binding protein [Streptomyces sp. 150FB]|uniref:phosphate/phosphite/phosphonate ABC transporter substrate-binding protein n=1 Tax=Streptomyces sp. 150FB TaxID=1576605 RepID=UPI00099C74F5|nr:phosphate/phosphite/phosphonate ABC transporter substrate-binding protein [Streptomyces sp. 150FB]